MNVLQKSELFGNDCNVPPVKVSGNALYFISRDPLVSVNPVKKLKSKWIKSCGDHSISFNAKWSAIFKD